MTALNELRQAPNLRDLLNKREQARRMNNAVATNFGRMLMSV